MAASPPTLPPKPRAGPAGSICPLPFQGPDSSGISSHLPRYRQPGPFHAVLSCSQEKGKALLHPPKCILPRLGDQLDYGAPGNTTQLNARGSKTDREHQLGAQPCEMEVRPQPRNLPQRFSSSLKKLLSVLPLYHTHHLAYVASAPVSSLLS